MRAELQDQATPRLQTVVAAEGPERSAAGDRRPVRLVTRVPSDWRTYLRAARFGVTKAGSAAVRRSLRYWPGTSRLFGPPRAFVATLRDYAEQAGDGAAYVELYPEHQAAYTWPLFLPRPPDHDPERGLRPEFARQARLAHPAAGVAVIEGGRVLTERGSVIAPPDQFIAEVSDAWTAGEEVIYPIFLTRRLPRVTTTDETVAVLTSHCSRLNYGHWIVDTIPRLHLLEKSGIPYDRIVVPDAFGFHRDTLALLGVDRAKMITEPDLHLEARRLVVPSFPGLYGAPPRWACAYLRDRFLRHARPAARRRRLLISRDKPGAIRKITNEDALYDALRPFGVERLFPEDLPFTDEISLFNDAEIVIGACGAGLANLMWCQPGTAVIELFSPRYVSAMNWVIANQIGLRYAYALGVDAAPPITKSDRGIYCDIEANIDELVRLFKLLCPP